MVVIVAATVCTMLSVIVKRLFDGDR